MNTIFLALLLLDSSLLLPPRAAMENPAAVSNVPAKIKKDYDKLWARFVAGKADAQVTKDLDKLLKKQKNLDAAVIIQAYIDLYRGNDGVAGQKFKQALALNSANRISLFYLAELSFARSDYAEANRLYSLLLAMDSSRTDVEPKRQKALLLATEELLRSAALAEQNNRLSEAEQLYRHALTIVPQDPILHLRLASLLAKENKSDEASAERKAAEDLSPRRAVPNAPTRTTDDLDDLGRWGKDIGVLRQIQNSPRVTREQVAALIVRYFPQVTERSRVPQIVTDIDMSWARSEIQTVVDAGLMYTFPNHTFDPSGFIDRGDLATALARLIGVLGLPAMNAPPIPTPDVSPTNSQYGDIQLVLARGVMTLQDSGVFGLSDTVSGAGAVQSAERLLRSFQQVQR